MPQPQRPKPKSSSPTPEEQMRSASALLDHLQTEIQTAQKHSAILRSQAEVQTAQILKDRKGQLQAIENDAQKRIVPLNTRAMALFTDVAALEQRKIQLETDLTGIETTITARRGMVEALEQRFPELEHELADRQVARQTVDAQIAALKDQIAPLQDQITEFRGQIERLTVSRDTLKLQLDDFTTDWEIARAEKRREVGVAEAKRDTLLAESEELAHDMELQRDDLARRIKATAEREKVVTQRESKAKRDEAVNLRNSQLMQL